MFVPDNPDWEYQWYLEGIALIGETFSELTQHYGEGAYQVRVLDGNSCKVSVAYEYAIPEFNFITPASICNGETYELGGTLLSETGFYIDTLKNKDNCDSIVMLDLNVIGDEFETIEASIFEGEKFEIEGNSFTTAGVYQLELTSSLGCKRLVTLNLNTFPIFIPNAFSPNADGFNDFFAPMACLLYTSPSPRDATLSRMPSSA